MKELMTTVKCLIAVQCGIIVYGGKFIQINSCVGREGRGGGGEGGGEGGMTVIHIIIGMFNSNPMIPQYLNNNLT